MSLTPYVQIVARGQGRARPLTLDEAQAAMGHMLNGTAEPEALGALLMVLRLRGEVPAEIAGFTAGLRAHIAGTIPKADLDWPVYAAGRTRGAPLFILAARLVTLAGYSVSMHGWNASDTLRDFLHLAGPQVRYDSLESLSPEAFALLTLRDTFGLRSCINTVLRMWNPSVSDATLQGVFHPSYRSLQAEAAALLGQQTLTIIKGGGGEFERHPGKDVTLFGLRDGTHMQLQAPAIADATRRLHETDSDVDIAGLWHGTLADDFAIATITGTAALALWTLKAEPTLDAAQRLAQSLWDQRHATESLSA